MSGGTTSQGRFASANEPFQAGCMQIENHIDVLYYHTYNRPRVQLNSANILASY